MSDTAAPPPISGIVELLDGFKASKAMFTAVSLGVFDRLHEAPAGCGELARDLNCAEHALERLLGYCAAKELIVQDAEGRWSMTMRLSIDTQMAESRMPQLVEAATV